jgi:integrase
MGRQMQAKSQLALVVPTGEKRAVSAGRRSNSDYRKREYLTPVEIEKLIEAAKGNRYGHRDATMILVAFRHGFRASEIIALEWSDIDFDAAEMHVERKKRGKSPRHPICGDELRALRRLHKEQDPRSVFVFRQEGRPAFPGARA